MSEINVTDLDGNTSMNASIHSEVFNSSQEESGRLFAQSQGSMHMESTEQRSVRYATKRGGIGVQSGDSKSKDMKVMPHFDQRVGSVPGFYVPQLQSQHQMQYAHQHLGQQSGQFGQFAQQLPYPRLGFNPSHQTSLGMSNALTPTSHGMTSLVSASSSQLLQMQQVSSAIHAASMNQGVNSAHDPGPN